MKTYQIKKIVFSSLVIFFSICFLGANKISAAQRNVGPITIKQEIEVPPVQAGAFNQQEILAGPIESQNLLPDQNPKLSGTTDSLLKIINIETVNVSGLQRLLFSGKAEPRQVFKLFIFSEDPIVITLVADQNGNWNYRLDKDLKDGQHEAFIAVTDSNGKIISKSNPIAFIKTAQAASVIPVSALEENLSPLDRLHNRFFLIALAVVFIFIILAIVLISILTRKRK